MKLKGKIYLALIACTIVQRPLLAQSNATSPDLPAASPLDWKADQPDSTNRTAVFHVNNIYINGHHKTKSYIIEREVPFKRGDSLQLGELVQKFGLARQQLMNTRLFNDVVVSLKGFQGNEVDVQIDVKERWYLFPIPYFKLIDRNLSEWAKQGYGLDRVNYGLKFSYYNFTGRNDKLKAFFITGYTRQVQFSYEQPYADNSLKHGFGVNVSYSALRELNHLTLRNEQQFFPNDSVKVTMGRRYMNELFNATVSYYYRPALRTRHTVRLSYNFNRIDTAVFLNNPEYFANNRLAVSYPEASYTVEYNNIDYIAYPLKGVIADATITRKGLNKDMNLWMLNAKGTRAWPLGKETYLSLQALGSLKLPFDQPYFNQRLFGYGEYYLRGLENYVIDGVGGFLVKNTLRKQVLSFSVPFFRFKSHERIPFRMFVKTYGDLGYAYNKNTFGNSLENRMLYTAGAGVDFLTYYDFVFRIEYSFNQLGQNGLFLHFKNDF